MSSERPAATIDRWLVIATVEPPVDLLPEATTSEVIGREVKEALTKFGYIVVRADAEPIDPVQSDDGGYVCDECGEPGNGHKVGCAWGPK